MKQRNLKDTSELGNYRFNNTNQFAKSLIQELMKPIYLIIIITMLLSFHSQAQTTSVQSAIISNALEHPGLTEFHSLDISGMPVALFIASEQDDLVNMVVTFRGYKARIVAADAFKGTNVKRYFLIRKLAIESDRASTLLRYYQDNSVSRDFGIQLQRQGDKWQISQFNESGR